MLDLTCRKHRELSQTADDVVPIDIRLSVSIPSDDIVSLIESLRKTPYFRPTPDQIGWDICRHADAYENFESALISLKDDASRTLVEDVYSTASDEAESALRAHIESRLASFNRPRQPNDRLLVDVMDEARHRDWVPSQHIASELARLEEIAQTSRDRLHAEWVTADEARSEAVFQAWSAEQAKAESEKAAIEKRLDDADSWPMDTDEEVARYRALERSYEAEMEIWRKTHGARYWPEMYDPEVIAARERKNAAALAAVKAKPLLQVTNEDLATLGIRDRLDIEGEIMMARYTAQKELQKLSAVPLPIPPVNSLIGPREDFMPADAEDALALDFASQHVGDLRYVSEWGKWMRWDGAKWRDDRTAAAYDLIRYFVRQMAFRSAGVEAKKLATAQKVAAVERLARTDQRIAVVADIWDADPWLLNTPGGVIDLRTGESTLAAPDFHMTKITAVAAGGECPTWLAFLNKSLAGDVELIAFVQRMLGYALTGDTREHALFFLFGPGGNGKGVLLNTVAAILGDYNKTAPVDTFIDSHAERHPTDLAGLRGARLVTASETEKGRRWAEAKIKALTGGDRISARFMRQDFFEFVPQFKLVIAGNHKPGLRSVDEAIRRRLHLIPFTVKIPTAERDAALPEKLRAEWGGILAWMIEGCMAWQRQGLQPPAAVRSATDDYLESEDAVSTWLDERCERVPEGFVSRQDLFTSWGRWAESAREHVGTLKQFLETMRQREIEEHKRNGVRGFRGIKMRDVPVQFPPCPVPMPRS